MAKLKDLMTEAVVYLTPDDTVKRAADEMKSLNVGTIPICDRDRRLLGMITDRDIAVRVVAEGRTGNEPLKNYYTPNPVTATKDMDVEDAAQTMMEHQIRRLPVVENGKLVGIVSLGDLAVDQKDQELSGDTLEEISRPAKPNEQNLKGSKKGPRKGS